MIVDLEYGDRARVTMSRQFVAVDNESTEEVIAVKLEDFTATEFRTLELVLTVREARRMTNYIEWLALKIEDEETGS